MAAFRGTMLQPAASKARMLGIASSGAICSSGPQSDAACPFPLTAATPTTSSNWTFLPRIANFLGIVFMTYRYPALQSPYRLLRINASMTVVRVMPLRVVFNSPNLVARVTQALQNLVARPRGIAREDEGRHASCQGRGKAAPRPVAEAVAGS